MGGLLKVKDVMVRDVVYAEIPESRDGVLKLMSKYGKAGFPVVKKGTRRLVGIVTRSDLINKPDEEQLALLMTRNPITVSEDDPVEEASSLLIENDVRRLPVIRGGDLVGIISIADIVHKVIASSGLLEPIKGFMRRKVTVIWEKTPLPIASIMLRFSGVEALPVINDEGRLSGMISISDIVSCCEVAYREIVSSMKAGMEAQAWDWDTATLIYISKGHLTVPNKLVSDVMVKQVITALEYDSVSSCASKMRNYDIDQLPVVSSLGDFIGMVYDVDLLKALLKKSSLTLPHKIL